MGKAEKVHFSDAVVLCNMELHLTKATINSIGQGHVVTFAKDHSALVHCL